MKDARFGIGENIVPLKAPVDSAGTAYATPFVDLKNALHATFFYYMGVVTAASADQNIVVTMEAATAAASGSEVAIAFKYRLSGATGANTLGAITAATSTGVSLDTTSADGKLLLVSSRWIKKVSVIDIATGQLVRQVKVGKSPHGIWTLDHAKRY